jgi:hypothetical protein
MFQTYPKDSIENGTVGMEIMKNFLDNPKIKPNENLFKKWVDYDFDFQAYSKILVDSIGPSFILFFFIFYFFYFLFFFLIFFYFF